MVAEGRPPGGEAELLRNNHHGLPAPPLRAGRRMLATVHQADWLLATFLQPGVQSDNNLGPPSIRGNSPVETRTCLSQRPLASRSLARRLRVTSSPQREEDLIAWAASRGRVCGQSKLRRGLKAGCTLLFLPGPDQTRRCTITRYPLFQCYGLRETTLLMLYCGTSVQYRRVLVHSCSHTILAFIFVFIFEMPAFSSAVVLTHVSLS